MTGEWQQCEETSDEDPGGGRDPDGADGGVKTLLGDEEPSLEGERECLVLLWSSIVVRRRRRWENPKQKSEGMRDG
jgi:hypothetical protein